MFIKDTERFAATCRTKTMAKNIFTIIFFILLRHYATLDTNVTQKKHPRRSAFVR